MNWRNVKIFFIVILTATNLFLLINYTAFDRESSKIDDTAIADLVSLLSSNGISVDSTLIPNEHLSADIIETGFDSGYYERVASHISLSERESVNIMPDNSLRIIMKNTDQFLLDQKFGFEYVSGGMPQLTADEFDELFSSDENAAALGFTVSSLTRGEKKLVEKFLYPEELSGDDSFSYELIRVYLHGDTKIAVCRQTVDSVEVRDHVMYIELSGGKVCRAAGVWFFPQNSETYSSDLYDQLSILFEELEYKNALSASSADDDISYSITDIGFTYCIYWNTRQDRLFFIPAWKIVTDMGETRFYNAVNCELYE